MIILIIRIPKEDFIDFMEAILKACNPTAIYNL